MRRITLLALAMAGAGYACSGADPTAVPGTFYLSGTVTSASNGAPFEAEIDVYDPLGDQVAETRTSAAGRYELTFSDTKCRKGGAFQVAASASGGGYYPAFGTLPCTAKGSLYVVDLKMVLR